MIQFLTVLLLSLQADALTIVELEDTELKKVEIRDVVSDSVAEALGTYSFVVDTFKLTEIHKNDGGKTVAIKVVTEVVGAEVLDPEFGDPIFEFDTQCESLLTKSEKGIYTEELTETQCKETADSFDFDL